MTDLNKLQHLALARDVRTQRAVVLQTEAAGRVRQAERKLARAQDAMAQKSAEADKARQGLLAQVHRESTGWRVLQTLGGIDLSRQVCAQASQVVTACTATVGARQAAYEQARRTTLQAMHRTRSLESTCMRMQRAAALQSEMLMEDLEDPT